MGWEDDAREGGTQRVPGRPGGGPPRRRQQKAGVVTQRWACAGLVLALCALAGGAVAADQGADVPPGLRLPEVVEAPAPEYPVTALADDVEADVIFRLVVGVDGAPREVEPVALILYRYDADGYLVEEELPTDADPYGFVDAARGAMEGYRFMPARFAAEGDSGEGAPVEVELTWRLSFTLETVEEERLVLDEDPYADVPASAHFGQALPANLVGRLQVFGAAAVLGDRTLRLVAADGGEGVAHQTDAEGRFAFREVPAGRWTLTLVPLEGERQASVTTEIVLGERTEVVLFVERVEEEAGLVVTRTEADAPPAAVTRRTLLVTEIRRIPGNAGDPLRAVQNLPGVARAPFGGGAIVVRGSAPGDTGFLIDGAPLPTLYHFGGIRSVFPAEILEAIDFYPGAFSVQYGRATGGYLIARTREPRRDGYHGFVDVNVFDSGALVEGPITENLSFSLSARRSYIDAVLLPLADALELTFATAPRYWDYQARLQYNPDPHHRFSLMAYGSNDLVDFVLQDEEDLPPEQRGGIRAGANFHALLFRYDASLSERVRNELRLQVSRQNLGFFLGRDVFFELALTGFFMRNTTTFTLSEAVAFRAGMDILTAPASLNIRAPQPPREGEGPSNFDTRERFDVEADLTLYEPAVFAEVELRPHPDWLLVPGGRLEWYRQPGAWATDGRMMVRHQITEEVAWKVATGTFHQAPEPFETDATRTFGNPDLDLPWAIHYVAGVETLWGGGWTLNVEGFFKDLRDLVSRTDAVLEIDGETLPALFDNAGRGRVYGVETFLRYDGESPWSGWLTYTWQRSERRDRPGDPWRPFSFDQPHLLTALVSYRLPRDWNLGTRFRLVSGNPTTPVVGAVYNANQDAFEAISGEPNSVRFPTFHQLDVRVDKRWTFERWRLELYLDLQNAYNRMNAEAFAYSYDYRQRARITGLPIIPSFGLRGEF